MATKKVLLKTIDEKFLNPLNPNLDSFELSSFTHYIHNKTNVHSKKYKQKAVSYLKSILEEKYTDLEIDPNFAENSFEYLNVDYLNRIPFPSPKIPRFEFIDLFAGIGGFRLALQNLGGKCVFTSEWDQKAKKTYQANFGEVPFGDITMEKTKRFIPDNFDVLCAGFPCQAFSIAGKRGGFEDTRGTLFFDVADIIKRKKPKAIFLENVKGLISHDKGKTLNTILNVLRNDLDYYVPNPQVLNAKNFGLAQNRERVFIVGFRNDLKIQDFEYPQSFKHTVKFEDVREENPVSVKYYLSNTYLNTLERHKARHEAKGNGFGFQIIANDGIANAVVCGGMGRERNLVYDNRLTNFIPITKIKGEVNRLGIRKMTPREWARLQGFPDEFIIPVADVSAYKQFGNSVAVPAIQATANLIIQKILNHVNRKQR